MVWCPDLGLREWLVDEVAGLAELGAEPFRTDSVHKAIQTPQRMVLLVPSNERAVVEEREVRRDQLLAPPRTQPVVVFLPRNGDGWAALANAPGLSSRVRGSDVDPDQIAAVDVAADRARFQAEVGRSVEDWLTDWSADKIPRNGESFARAYWAALLEQR